jgi:hypothetical protein
MKILLSLITLVLLFGCPKNPPSVLTSDRSGNVLTMQTIPETGARSDTPTGVAPRQVTAEVITKTGAKATIVKKPFRKPVVYLNEQAKAEGLSVVQPKDPWWKWPLIILIVLGAGAAVYFLKQIRLFISAIFRR